MYKKVNDCAKWVAINSGGIRKEFELKPTLGNVLWLRADVESRVWNVSSGHETTNWENSLIEIDAQYKHEFVHPESVCFSVDKDGRGYEYRLIPVLNNAISEWVCFSDGTGTKAVDHNYKGDWRESLQMLEEPKQEPTQWNGEGLPPVGTVCEVVHCNEWHKTYIIGNDKAGNTVYDCDDMPCIHYSRYSSHSCPSMFRPIKTDREKVIDKALSNICYDGEPWDNLESWLCEYIESAITQAYDAGMLKMPEGK